MGWVLSAIILAGLVAPMSVHAQITTHAQAIERMAADPDGAEAVLRKLENTVGRLDLLLFLHAFRPSSTARDAEIARLKSTLDKLALEEASADKFLLRYVGPVLPSDGGDESLIPSLRYLSVTQVAMPLSAFYAIPCAILIRRPGLLAATEPIFSGNSNNFLPRSGCSWGRGRVAGFPDRQIADFEVASRLADSNFLKLHGGSIRFLLGASQNLTIEMVKLNPRALPPEPDHAARPYETWSYLSLANRRAFVIITRAYDDALTALIAYYSSLGLPAASVEGLARRALFHVPFGADCGEAPPPHTIRTLLLDGASPADIAVEAKKYDGATHRVFAVCARTAGIDPLIHLAVSRPETLPLLSQTGIPWQIDARNDFGKTPLMAAAQIDSLESAHWLLTQGAAVNAVTETTGKWDIPKHGRRTALHYAAANAGLPVIRVLIVAGADILAKDDEGLRPLDYLIGKGPVRPNSVLSVADRHEAERLLGRP